MIKKFYVDTCIWRDLLENRKSGFLALGDLAFGFLSKCRDNGCAIIVSSFVIEELNYFFPASTITDLFESFLKQIVFVEPSEEAINEASILSKKTYDTHLSDILHAVVAKEQSCVMITRDKHFHVLTNIVKVCLPEEVLFD
ncbi:MAG: hypothetical protein WCW13_03215 [archaeon]|jgi:rRNA-processing protein FCF1